MNAATEAASICSTVKSNKIDHDRDAMVGGEQKLPTNRPSVAGHAFLYKSGAKVLLDGANSLVLVRMVIILLRVDETDEGERGRQC